ncbi:hypothetical protein CKAH01_15051 [Colletotrichum kahawae]|uniref:Uncharacterized protein n=1 Tax=Colletotrichum kahawae TaxID=34407 RepID=A0AAD9YJ76_COLKA|nr:hypothetical protein CKAH01_15051 [Colletotrichum kahawae]
METGCHVLVEDASPPDGENSAPDECAPALWRSPGGIQTLASCHGRRWRGLLWLKPFYRQLQLCIGTARRQRVGRPKAIDTQRIVTNELSIAAGAPSRMRIEGVPRNPAPGLAEVAPRAESVNEQLARADGRGAGALERSIRGLRGAAGHRRVATCLLMGLDRRCWARPVDVGKGRTLADQGPQSAAILDSEQLASATDPVMLLQGHYNQVVVLSAPNCRYGIPVAPLYSRKGCHM